MPIFIRQFLRMIFCNSVTNVEFASKTRGKFLMARGVRQGCPARGFLFVMAFDPIFRWLLQLGHSKHPALTNFTQPVLCAYADDFANAVFSFRALMPALCSAFKTVDSVAGLNLNHHKCCQDLLDWVSQAVRIGPEGHLHRWTAPRKKFIQ